MDPAPVPDTSPDTGAASRAPRLAWRLLGLLAAALLGWLIVRGWQQPGLLLDIANMRLC